MPTIVSAYKALSILVLDLAGHDLLGVFQGNVHVAVESCEHTGILNATV